MYNMTNESGGISPTRKSIQAYISLYTGSNFIVMVDDFDTLQTRHICSGSNQIILLSKIYIPVPTTKGLINAEIFYCSRCRKIILNKSSVEFI